MNNAQSIALRIVFFAAAAVTGLKMGIFLMSPAVPQAEEETPRPPAVEQRAPAAPRTVATLPPPSATLPPIAPWQAVEPEPAPREPGNPLQVQGPPRERKAAPRRSAVSYARPGAVQLAVPQAAPPVAVEPAEEVPPEEAPLEDAPNTASPPREPLGVETLAEEAPIEEVTRVDGGEAPPEAESVPGAAALFVKACFLRDRGDLVAAAEAFERVHELDPTRIVARRSAAHTWCRVGATRLRNGDVPGAREALTRSVELEPCCPSSLHNAGVAHARAGQWAEAEDAFRHAAEQDADIPRRYLVLGLVFLQRGDVTAAERVARQLRGLDRSLAKRLDRGIRESR